jgi:hypothetical protein
MSWPVAIVAGVVGILAFLQLWRVLRLLRARGAAGWRDPNDPKARRKRLWSRLGTIAAMLLLGSWLIFVGVTDWRNQHSGVPARITVSKCTSGKHAACWGAQPATMPQTVADPSNPGQTMEIQVNNPDRSNIKINDAGDRDVGHEIAVHVHYRHYGSGTFAQKDGSAWPLVLIGIGCALGVGAGHRPCASPTERPTERLGVDRRQRVLRSDTS